MLYQIREAIKGIFSYPKQRIDPQSSDDYDTYWREKRGHHIGELSSWQKARADIILDILTKDKNQKSLGDIGCGDGSIMSYLKHKTDTIVRCVGYDSSMFALERAREFGIETNLLDISKKEAHEDITAVSYYLMLEVLEHIPHSEELLLSALTKVEKGIFFSFPNTGYIRHRARLLFGRFPVQWRVFPNEHVRFWTLTDLRWWLKALNITNYEIHCYKGVPGLNRMLPGLFAAGFVVYVPKPSMIA